ncbi:hypothetical protein EYF80_058969 [Liparis tanakae]|uniref:Uncharacterized protein n=1 Tax=Liparis tanakae TaxID=230148 RepID=A0A4Z2EPY0_9TELE|nr:hypothetical protein EYF80_058969 [Liparis tanakae]
MFSFVKRLSSSVLIQRRWSATSPRLQSLCPPALILLEEKVMVWMWTQTGTEHQITTKSRAPPPHTIPAGNGKPGAAGGKRDPEKTVRGGAASPEAARSGAVRHAGKNIDERRTASTAAPTPKVRRVFGEIFRVP